MVPGPRGPQQVRLKSRKEPTKRDAAVEPESHSDPISVPRRTHPSVRDSRKLEESRPGKRQRCRVSTARSRPWRGVRCLRCPLAAPEKSWSTVATFEGAHLFRQESRSNVMPVGGSAGGTASPFNLHAAVHLFIALLYYPHLPLTPRFSRTNLAIYRVSCEPWVHGALLKHCPKLSMGILSIAAGKGTRSSKWN